MWRYVPERIAGPALATVLTLAGCASTLPDDGANEAYVDGSLPVRLPVMSMLDRRYATVVRQRYDFSCGSAALATLLHFHYDDPQTESTVFAAMWRTGDHAMIQRLGFSLLDMKRYLESRGIASDGYNVTVAQIAAARVPGIALIDVEGYKHFVTVKAIDGGSLVVGDPALGVRRMTTAEFERIWNGVLFVLNAPPAGRKPLFDARRDVELAPPGLAAADRTPLSLQALALMRPLPGDF